MPNGLQRMRLDDHLEASSSSSSSSSLLLLLLLLHVVAVAVAVAAGGGDGGGDGGGGVPVLLQILNAKAGCSQRVGQILFLVGLNTRQALKWLKYWRCSQF